MQTGTESSRMILQPGNASVLQLAQITDCHILANSGDCLRGVNTRGSFEAVWRAMHRDQNALDLVLATGDLSQDGSPASYQYLAEHFNSMNLPLCWLPGNHDDPALMQACLRGETIFPANQISIGNWIILLLDSTIAGESSGHLASAEIDFLQTELAAEPEAHVLVCLHHQAMPSGSDWIDQLGLQPPRQLADLIEPHANVRAVLWGHVHQQLDQNRDGICWMSTPSTCMQFRPGSKTFALDTQTPGYRKIELHADGRVVSSVHRLDSVDFDACRES